MDTTGRSLRLAFARSLMTAVAIGAVSFLMAGCSDDSADVTGGLPTVSAVEVSPDEHTLFSLGDRFQLSATATDERGREISGVSFDWSTRDADVATVDADGEVTGVGVGSTVVAASTGAARDSAVIWVDPELTLQNYCADCHGAGTHGVTFATNACRACHSMSLSPLDEDHASTINGHMSVSGGFQLAGAHEALACGMCHDLDSGEPLFSPADYTDCISCHQSEYERQHAGSDFPTTCLTCHNMSSWTDVTFDHGAVSGGFALVGTHQTLACTACHDAATGEPLYNPAGQDDCYACHQGDYQSEHAGSGYPTTCLTCHSTSGWGGASFNHDSQYFRIFSGTHAGRWASCTTCHTNSNDYSEFTCFACHAHNQTDMDSEHSSVSGYNYDSQQCRACHPNV